MLLTVRDYIFVYSTYEADHFGVFDLMFNLDSIVEVIFVNRRVGDRSQSRVASREAWKATELQLLTSHAFIVGGDT